VLDLRRQLSRTVAMVDFLGLGALETLDHGKEGRDGTAVKRYYLRIS
jgi:hypothetical protein